MATMNDFLLELGTEELPPKALATLSAAFSEGIVEQFAKHGLRGGSWQAFASPRRLAVLIKDLPSQAEDQATKKLGPNVKAAFDAGGQPSKAAQGFAKSCGVEFSALSTEQTDKGERLAYLSFDAGKHVHDILQEALDATLAALPIPKRMRWAARRDEFIRPVEWLLAMHGSQHLHAEVFGIQSGRCSYGHRFMGHEGCSPLAIEIATAAQYQGTLEKDGFVLVDYEQRRQRIRDQVNECEESLNGRIVVDADLLDEVCSLVEWPQLLLGSFDKAFLKLPAEALISSMQAHQKYFHVTDNDGNLLPHFVTIANIDSKRAESVIEGNQRVIRPRLADAQFFYATDLELGLDAMAERLSNIVFQDQLGSIGEKTQRIAQLATWLAEHCKELNSDASALGLYQEAARLCKADLVSDMVGEFADLQGLVGRYYATDAGLPNELAHALEEHYLPRFAGDRLPNTGAGVVLSLADRLDTLVGIFGIGQIPTGSKDPFALRRSALGLLRILIEKRLSVNLGAAIEQALALHGDLPQADLANTVQSFVMDRLRAWYGEQGIEASRLNAVLAVEAENPLDIDHRVRAVQAFSELEQASALAAANKRVGNLLSKSEDGAQHSTLDPALFSCAEESTLLAEIIANEEKLTPLMASADYRGALHQLASLKDSVDAFFDSVMVMDEDLAQRRNRLALLDRLRTLFLQIADISKLAV